MKRIRVAGAGAVAAMLATAVAFFLNPRSGPGHRAALKRGSGRVARQSANVAAMVGSTPRRGRRGDASALEDVRAVVEEALVATLGTAGLSLSVVVGDGVITVRGEVDDLAQVASVSRTLADHGAATEIVNLVRVRVRPDAAAAT